jgi:ribosomal protein S18 acetylase RimI-like enzyme
METNPLVSQSLALVTPSLLDLLHRLELAANRAMSRTRKWVDVGAFRAYFDETSDLIWLNYAAPIQTLGSEAQTSGDVAALKKEFKRRRRTLRFEFIEPLWPGLGAMLRAAGLRLEAAQPLMICSPATARRRNTDQLRIQSLNANDPDASLDMFVQVSALAFGRDCPLHKLAELRVRLRIELQAGARRALMGWIGNEPTGVAALSPTESVGELVGVATLPNFRRRGVASALSSHLVFDHFHRGGDVVWLSAEDAAAQEMYRTIGFADAGIYANYISG